MTVYFLEGGTIAAVVTARSAESDGAAVKDLPDNGGDLETAQALALRARIVLGCACGPEQQGGSGRRAGDGANRRQVAPALVECGLDGLLDEPRPGAPRTIDEAKVENVIVQTLESRPAGATHWRTRSMARHSGISTSSVGRIWRAFGLQPYRVETFKLSTDPLFVDKVRDIVGLYLNPPDRPGAVRRRKVADPGARPHSAAAADAAGASRAAAHN